MPRDCGPGRQRRTRKHFVGQSWTHALAGNQAACSRRGDESGGPSARRRRRENLRRPQSGDAMGTADPRIQDAPKQAYEEDDRERSEREMIADFQLPIAELSSYPEG